MWDENTPTYQALNRLLTYYLAERDIDKILSMVTDDIYSIGTSTKEEAFNKKDFELLNIADIEGMPSAMEYSISRYHEKQRSSDIFDCFSNVSVIIKVSETDKLHLDTRFMVSFTRVKGVLMVNTMHMSQASVTQDENEYFPLHFASSAMKNLDNTSQKQLLEILLENMPGGIMGGFDEVGFPVYVLNDTMLEMLGYTYDEFIASTKGLLENIIHPDDFQPLYDAIYEGFAHGNEYEAEHRLIKSDGSFIWVHNVGRRIVVEDGRTALICVVLDVSETVLATEHLIEETMRDPLTNLYNRKAGELLITEKLEHNAGFTFLVMDIDNFKLVNDMYGHHMGDTILIYLAKLLRKDLPCDDIIVRLGGDEFIIYIPSNGNLGEIHRTLEAINNQYIQNILEHCPHSQSTLSVGGVCGMGVHSFTDIYQKADKILYETKENEKGHIKIIPLV